MNHTLTDCYSYNNVCTYCKQQGHSTYDCPQTKQKQSNNQSSQVAQTPTMKCPYCSAGHLGKNSPGLGSPQPKGQGPLPQRNNQLGTVNTTHSTCKRLCRHVSGCRG